MTEVDLPETCSTPVLETESAKMRRRRLIHIIDSPCVPLQIVVFQVCITL